MTNAKPSAAREVFWWVMTFVMGALGIGLIYFFVTEYSIKLWFTAVIFVVGLPLAIINLRQARIARRRND
ncbi:hypothetical protein [Subtercola lobariae]|nr:hypothetical protein [Subtercola lobariae]